jgi:hypothetical protein
MEDTKIRSGEAGKAGEAGCGVRLTIRIRQGREANVAIFNPTGLITTKLLAASIYLMAFMINNSNTSRQLRLSIRTPFFGAREKPRYSIPFFPFLFTYYLI